MFKETCSVGFLGVKYDTMHPPTPSPAAATAVYDPQWRGISMLQHGQPGPIFVHAWIDFHHLAAHADIWSCMSMVLSREYSCAYSIKGSGRGLGARLMATFYLFQNYIYFTPRSSVGS